MKDVIYNFIQQHMMIHIVLIALCRCHYWGYVYRPVDRSDESQTAR